MATRLPADAAAVRRALGVVRDFAGAADLAAADADRLAVVVEEWVANLSEHAGLPPDSRIGLRLARRPGGEIRVTVSDAGAPFDPRDAAFRGPNPERGGGAGLELLRAWSRIRAYRRHGGRNRLILEVGPA